MQRHEQKMKTHVDHLQLDQARRDQLWKQQELELCGVALISFLISFLTTTMIIFEIRNWTCHLATWAGVPFFNADCDQEFPSLIHAWIM